MLAGGQILPLITKLSLRTSSRSDFDKVSTELQDAVHPIDFLVLFVLGWAAIPIFGVLYYGLTASGRTRSFDLSYAYLVADHISQVARLAIVVYCLDCAVVVLSALGVFTLSNLSQASRGFAKILYTLWAAQRVSVFKRYLLSQAVEKKPSQLGRVAIIDRLADGFICVVVGLFLLDVMEVELGMAISSVFAFGSVGTLAVGLATQDLARQFVSGLAVSMTDRMQEGDEVHFGDGTAGFVEKTGW
jgi:small-conductance mechanosensitive channel